MGIKNLRWLGMSLLVVMVDQLTKKWVVVAFMPYEPHFFLPLVNWTLAFNTGAAFSFLNNSGPWHHVFFVAMASAMTLFLLIWLWFLPRGTNRLALAISLIIGGALGNLIDRLSHGAVIDFIDVHYKNYHWPVFNLADSAIFIGAVLMLIDYLRRPEGGL